MPAIRACDLARHWGTGSSYISMLRQRRNMPEFETFEAADAWRAVNAPAKRRAPRSDPGSTEPVAGFEERVENNNNNRHDKTPPSPPIDTREYLAPAGTDFDELMLRQAEQVAQVAHGLYLRACSRGDPGTIAAHLKNWSEAGRYAKDLREKFMELQERSRMLISIDKVMDIVGQQLQDLRLALVGLGERIAVDANPENPVLAKQVIDADVDRLMARITMGEAAIREETKAA